MTEKFSQESLPTPEWNIKERLIAAAKEVARLGGIDRFGFPADENHFLYGFRDGSIAYRILTDGRAGSSPLTIFIDERIAGGGGILASHKRYEFDAEGNVQCFVYSDSAQDLIDLNRAMGAFAGSQDIKDVKKAARGFRARLDQRRDQDEAAQRASGARLVIDEAELAGILSVLERELTVLRSQHKKRKKDGE